jgi:hypothetical protein
MVPQAEKPRIATQPCPDAGVSEITSKRLSNAAGACIDFFMVEKFGLVGIKLEISGAQLCRRPEKMDNPLNL